MNGQMIASESVRFRTRVMICLLAFIGMLWIASVRVDAAGLSAPTVVYVGDNKIYDAADPTANGTVTCGSGTASYNASSGILTLSDATIPAAEDRLVGSAIYADGNLMINLVGTNTFTDSRVGCTAVYVTNGDITIKGSGSLNITAGDDGIITYSGSILVDGTTLEIETLNEDVEINDGYAMYAGRSEDESAIQMITIRNGARITARTKHLSIACRSGVAIENSDVTVTRTGKYTSGGAIYTGGLFNVKASTITTTCGLFTNGSMLFDSSTIAASFINCEITNTIRNCRVNCKRIDGWDWVAIENSDVSLVCDEWEAIWAHGDIRVDNSRVTATCTAVLEDGTSNPLYAEGDVVISGTSEVTASGVGSSRMSIGGKLTASPRPNGFVEYKVGDDADSAREIEGSPFAGSVSYTQADEELNYRYTYIRTYGGDPVSREDRDERPGHHHVYEWETYKAATATADGIMRYRCKYCGTVEYEVPTAAYYVFNKDAQEAIRNAAANATVTVSTPIFISFHEMVKDALNERPDVTLIVDYRNASKDYEMTIPAGSGTALEGLYGDSQFAGFLYLGGAFATVEK